ncbi:hypothetical protein ACOTVD_09040 [Campylobacter jejuni]|uniref:hypothetical protein n=1 Tax=Campylobacter jejuni TaxID=197 RepID=UPI0008747C74|nr:hypothetical protein [Campylobacter jejuni]EAJ2975635.1 hypothetical protein [Campylobacter jejuni]EAJ8747103.1 hypothetical protein [Campylobacter jejuni]EDP2897572.1 hypothetical protein [Campylobacter jejuni]EEU7469635.1 hypothetical protein [Campylobacter jejuni]EGR9265307.1 hypothetical protein [Campylobacter jejuni]
MEGLSSTGEQLIATAYTFGAAAFVFAVFPFGFVIIKAIMDSKKPDVLPSSVFGVLLLAFSIHVVSCFSFHMMIQILDSQKSIYTDNYFSQKVFPLFWNGFGNSEGLGAGDIQSIVAESGASDNEVAKGSAGILHAVQVARDWCFILLPIFVGSIGLYYGAMMHRKDTYRQGNDYFAAFCWSMGSMVIAYILFYLWAVIASLALFIPNGGNLIDEIHKAYQSMIMKI